MVRDVGHDELSNEDRAAPPESMRKLVEKPDGRGLARQLDDPLSLRAQFRTCFGLGRFIEGREGWFSAQFDIYSIPTELNRTRWHGGRWFCGAYIGLLTSSQSAIHRRIWP